MPAPTCSASSLAAASQKPAVHLLPSAAAAVSALFLNYLHNRPAWQPVPRRQRFQRIRPPHGVGDDRLRIGGGGGGGTVRHLESQ
ncbi:unnamed protein product [Linum tenue]|uniref:Uncharacterized protein n=1 Tax=Linum tenue TaxID=586396 RepID=A0AAV0MX55_9ROSI|nr:unnamed protein product [Linum tenue]